MWAVVVGAFIFFAAGPALHLQEDFGEWVLRVLGHEHPVELSDTDKQDIANRVVEALEGAGVGERRRTIIREVERDSSITAIGVDTEPRVEGPRVKIERYQFPEFGASADIGPGLTSQRRTEFDLDADVVIVRPSLRAGEDKPRWRFTQQDREWSADIEDQEFIRALQEKQTGLILAVGQHMTVDIAIDLRLTDSGPWHEFNRRIVKVTRPQVNRRQKTLV